MDNVLELPTQRISAAFGWKGFPHALFYRTQFALRFELGGEVSEQTPRFLQALDRARHLAKAVFADSAKLTAFASYDADARRTSGPAHAFKALRDMGFKSHFGPAEKMPPCDAEDGRCRYWHAAEFGNEPDQIDILAWASIAREQPVTPKAKWLRQIYVVDFQRGIAATAYDERGMDVIALVPTPLQALYDHHGDWLFDYDRPRMDETFSRNL